jgi:deazaflavin-dependent oxidoreductase (nitroreductase family)
MVVRLSSDIPRLSNDLEVGPVAMSTEQIRELNRTMVDRLRDQPPMPLVADTYELRVVRTRGRASGEDRTVPLAVVHHAGQRYLVAPDANRDWVANLDAHPGCGVEAGGSVEEVAATRLRGRPAAEVAAAYHEAATGPARAAFPFGDGATLDAVEAVLDRMAVFALVRS